MKKTVAMSIITILAVAIMVMGVLSISNNNSKTKELAEKADQVAALNADVADKAGQIEALNAEISEKTSEIETLKADVASKEKEIETLNAAITEKNSQIDTLSADVADQSLQIEALTIENKTKDVEIGLLKEMASGKSVSETDKPAVPEPGPDSSMTDSLQTFLYYWSANRLDDMLTLCSPSWAGEVENPKTALFILMGNRTPKEFYTEDASGTENDTSRTVTINTLMDRHNGKDPVRYRMNIIMVRGTDGSWYINPESLKSSEIIESTEPAITPAPDPTAVPETDADTPLYYNPGGGEYYHRDQNCKRVHERFLPLQGQLTYAELNKAEYSELKPCEICEAPARPGH